VSPRVSPLRRQVAALIVAASIAAPVYAKDTKSSNAAAAAAAPAVQIDNFGRINENYYRGALPTGRDFSDLSKLGVKTLIDLTNGDGDTEEQRMAESAGMKFVKIAMSTRIVPTPEQISTFLSVVNDPANQPVYVHCVGGKHRTGVMTAIYRMTSEKWAAEKAFKEMKSYKFGADFLHPEFKKFVFAFNPALAAADVLNEGPGNQR
jgi:tyrosine-protein phosphatase SIW14